MPFLNNRSLPASVKGVLPPSGQQVWRTTFNAQQAQGEDDATAEAAAWAELKQRGWRLDAQGNWNPPVGKAGLPFTLVKQDTPQRYTLGVVYAPNEVDTQGDFASAPTIERAAWQFMAQLQKGQALTRRTLLFLEALEQAQDGDALDLSDWLDEVTQSRYALGDQHSYWDESLGIIVESYLMPCDVFLNDQSISKGSWMLGVVWSPAAFSKIQAGDRTGYSMGGTGVRVPAEPAALLMAKEDAHASTLVSDLVKVLQAYTVPDVHVHMSPMALTLQAPEPSQVTVHTPDVTVHNTLLPHEITNVIQVPERPERRVTKEVQRDPTTQLITAVVEREEAD